MPIIQRLTRALLLMFMIGGSLWAAASCFARDDDEVVNVDFYVTVPGDTAPDAMIYLAGNLEPLGGWRADGVLLNRLENGQYHARLALPRARKLEYKVTRGSWETVEKGPAGEELHNRTLALANDAVERITVAAWRSASTTQPATTRASTITGDVRVHENFKSEHLLNSRRILVYLPPGYDRDPAARYPVLYMHDGQNLFDDATSFAGEWRADETAQRLITEGKIRPIIIVGIENAGGDRVDEYTPVSVLGEGGRGALYAKFVVEELKPFIDQTYRTQSDRAGTGVGGSSLGGLISLYLLKTHPQVFGQCAAVSPSLWWNLGGFLREAEVDASWARGARIWLDMGTEEVSDDPELCKLRVDESARLAAAFRKAGLTPHKDFTWQPIEGAGHNETAWADRFDEILIYLYGNRK